MYLARNPLCRQIDIRKNAFILFTFFPPDLLILIEMPQGLPVFIYINVFLKTQVTVGAQLVVMHKINALSLSLSIQG